MARVIDATYHPQALQGKQSMSKCNDNTCQIIEVEGERVSAVVHDGLSGTRR